ncbi:hypothetical protein BC828DRAFT_386260 [Blastocladiella britannica]|nr:hypothetical protein BC828DRAFT_386260 [Blastocladiella britannica]
MPKFVAHKSFGRQVLAVFLKDWTYQFKQSLATFAVYFVGMMVIILMKGQVGLSKETMCPDGTTGALLENSGSYRSYDPSGALYGHQGFPNCRPEVTTSRIGSSMGLCSPGSVRGCLSGDFYLSTLLYSSSRKQANGPARYWIHDPTDQMVNITALPDGVDPTPQTGAPERVLEIKFPGELRSGLGKRSDDFVHKPIVIKLDPIATADKFGPRLSVPEHPSAMIKKNLAAMYAKAEPMPAKCPQWFYMAGEGSKSFVTEDEDVYNVLRKNMPDYAFEVSQLSGNASKIEIVVAPTSLEFSAEMFLGVTSRGKCHQASMRYDYSFYSFSFLSVRYRLTCSFHKLGPRKPPLDAARHYQRVGHQRRLPGHDHGSRHDVPIPAQLVLRPQPDF